MGTHHLFEISMGPLMRMINEAVAQERDRIAIHPIGYFLHRTDSIDNTLEHEPN